MGPVGPASRTLAPQPSVAADFHEEKGALASAPRGGRALGWGGGGGCYSTKNSANSIGGGGNVRFLFHKGGGVWTWTQHIACKRQTPPFMSLAASTKC